MEERHISGKKSNYIRRNKKMAVIKSGSSTDELIVDPTSKAARVTEYLASVARPAWADNHATYSYSNPSFVIPATPTDIITIEGSASKTIAITRVWISTIQTTAGVNSWYLAKRSTAWTGGVHVAGVAVPHDSSDPAGSAVVGHWTTLFTGGGSLVGNVWGGRLDSPAPATAGIGGFVGTFIDFTRLYGKPHMLRGTGESLGINFNGAALPAGMTCLGGFTWFEF
jgi:hypothetical protein